MFFNTTTMIAFLPAFLVVNILLLVPYNNFFHSKPVWRVFFNEITQIPHSTTARKNKSKVSSNSIWISLCNVCMTMIMVVWRVQWSFIKNELVWCWGKGVGFYNLQNAFDDVLWRHGKLFGIQQPLHYIILNAGFILYINKNHVTGMLKLIKTNCWTSQKCLSKVNPEHQTYINYENKLNHCFTDHLFKRSVTWTSV